MKRNSFGLVVDGSANPNWKGGPIAKICEVCGKDYVARRAQAKSRYCSLQCVGISQRGQPQKPRTSVLISCAICEAMFYCVPARLQKAKCCSLLCRHKYHGKKHAGEGNPNWSGGLSRIPYPYNFNQISLEIRKRDGFVCRGLECSGKDTRLTAHHINYDKDDCRGINLITLCSSCNSKANFNRPLWQQRYSALMANEAEAA